MSKFNETLSLQVFRSKAQYLKQHLQVLDASLSSSSRLLKRHKVETDSIAQALRMPDGQHDVLNHPVKEYPRIFNYSRSKNGEYAIIELYNCFSNYLRSILGEMFEHSPLQIVGKDNSTLTFVELVNLGTLEKIQEKMIDKVFRKLENDKSTLSLLDNVLNHTDIVIPPDIKTTALMYLEMRHLFIHNQGKADERFEKQFGDKMKPRKTGKLPTDFMTVNTAIETILKLVTIIDQGLIANGNANARG